MKPFLLISTRPEDSIAEEELDTFLRFTGLEPDQLRQLRLEKGPEVARELQDLDLDEISGIFVGGSPFTTSTPQAEKTEVQVRVEKDLGELLDRVMDRGTPFFGACYGVGTLACHQGAVVDTTYGEAVTAPEVTLTEAGLADPICAGVPEVFQAFVAHKEAVTTLPPHAVVLGSGQACPVQMFRIKNNLYATQFHPELDGDYLAHRLGFYSGHGYFADDELAELQARVRLDDVSDSWKLLANFVSVHARDCSR